LPFVKSRRSASDPGQQTLIGSCSANKLIEIPANMSAINKALLDDQRTLLYEGW
jgi:hypothetical protein